MLHRTAHAATVDLLAEKIQKTTDHYPERIFSGKEGVYYQKIMQAVRQRQKELETQKLCSVILRQEPFVTAQDSIEFKGYL